jgi:phosphoenolpyruvate carboxylase
MKPIDKINELINLAERAFCLNVNLESADFEDASADYFDAIACEIHKIVKQNGLQAEYYKLSEHTIFETVADEWLERNPFNPEENPTVQCC